MTNEEVLESLQHMIGKPYADTLKTYITTTTGRKLVVGPNEMSTKDYNPERVHIQVDGAGHIYGFAFN
ncbi:I78 family peptidase inhibitor [Pseudomonas sp. HR96]|uniref:I78 family peptidase inhibitor n=1 Tax=Pseudomonas sp. HR96 TaxID=1027966 RepID=UPI002A7630D8|nr:I78 family peptidase inhibitor [Pseudomonas sp. HR96]WPO99868.1 I78 family peptidase inhibitor [Pseudomonas sp. HR96]